MQTYAQAHDRRETNWRKELEVRCEDMDYDKVHKLKDWADSWPTCAVGNLCNAIPRYGAEPVDSSLRTNGYLFADAVGQMAHYHGNDEFASANQCRIKALELLDCIEQRSAELLKQLGIVSNA